VPQPAQQEARLVGRQLAIDQRRQLLAAMRIQLVLPGAWLFGNPVIAHVVHAHGWRCRYCPAAAQPGIDRFARAEDPRTHGADRAAHLLRDLLVTQAFHLAQGDGGPQFFRQCFDSAHHRLFHLLRIKFAFGRVGVAQARTHVELLGIAGIDVVGGRTAVVGDR
jgi:hypothetical protein